MKKCAKILFAVFFLPAIFVGQNSPKINFDYGQFKVDSTHNLLEIYFQYNSETLLQSIKNYDQQENLKILFALKDSLQQSTNYSDTVLIPVSKSNSVVNSPSSPSLALHKFILPEGVYFLNIFLIDFDDSKIDITRNEKIVITPFAKSKSVLSDIQLAYKIDPTEENSIFTKNTLNIIPNPNASYSSEGPLLNYYTELYNVNRTSLLLSTFIVSQKLDVVYSKKKEIETDKKDLVEVGKINLLRYPTGVYTLQVILTDSTNNYAFGSEKKFYFYNKLLAQKSAEEDLTSTKTSSQFSILSGEECDYIFNVSKYIANDREQNQFESLTSTESKQNFLKNFWRKRKKNSETAYSAYESYLTKVNEANRKFKNIGDLGYKSDMGRIYLSYGNPDRIERFPNESNLKPYEIWHYDNIEGGILFIFGDLTGFSEYELLHSTKRGEMYDENWRRRISIR